VCERPEQSPALASLSATETGESVIPARRGGLEPEPAREPLSAGQGHLDQSQVLPLFLWQSERPVRNLGVLDAAEQSAINELLFRPPDSVGTRAQYLSQLSDSQEWMPPDQVQQLLVTAHRSGPGGDRCLPLFRATKPATCERPGTFATCSHGTTRAAGRA
jgi:hypothetical protein